MVMPVPTANRSFAGSSFKAEASAAGGLRAMARADWAERLLQFAGFGESAYTMRLHGGAIRCLTSVLASAET